MSDSINKRSRSERRSWWLVASVLVLILTLAPLLSASTVGWAQSAPAGALALTAFNGPTTSSPISLSADESLLWVVNPDDGSVSVMGNLDATPSVLRTIKNVAREPQAIALDTSNHAYVASPPDNGVVVLQVTSTNPFNAIVKSRLTTGAEPWNIVASPDGSRVFVANSGQDTITVIRTDTQSIVGSVDLAGSACNVGDSERHFQPRGLAVTADSNRLYVARFLSFTQSGGVQGDDAGKEGIVCQLDIPAVLTGLPTVVGPIALAPRDTGFAIDANGDGTPDPTSAFPNQMQSIVIRGDQAYLPNIAASPSKPLKFNTDTHAFVNVIDNVESGAPVDASASKFLNLHLGARRPPLGVTRLFFANPWAMAFTSQSGNGDAYVVSAGSDLLVKVNVDASGVLTFTDGISTTRYIDLNDPSNPATSGRNAGKNPLGIVIRGDRAFVMNYLSRNVSVVNLTNDEVEQVIETTPLPPFGSFDEQLLVGKEMFFSSRGHFEAPSGQTATVSLDNRLSSEGWQNCASCHFAGLTDGVIWQFVPGPRKSIPMNGTWSPHNGDDQRLLNYSAFFDEVQDFEINVRNVSGPGALATPIAGSVQDPNHGLIISDTGDVNFAPAVVNAFALPNAGRPQVLVRLPGSNTAWPALDAMKEWIRFGIRSPEGALTTDQLPAGNSTGGLEPTEVAQGRRLFFRSGCQTCHGGAKWTTSHKDFVSPPDPADIATEAGAPNNAIQGQFLFRFLADIGSFNLGVAGQGNDIDGNVGAVEVATNGQTGLGADHNGDGKGAGFNTPSLLGIFAVPPYYHNGACETLACVLSNEEHRSSGRNQDLLSSAANQEKVVAWLKTLDADTPFPVNLIVRRHDIFFDPPRILKGQSVTVGVNVSLFGTKADLADLLADLGQSELKVNLNFDFGGSSAPGLVELAVTPERFKQDFGQAVISTTLNVPSDAATNLGNFTFTVDPNEVFPEDNENDNSATRTARLRTPAPDRTPPFVTGVFISDDDPFNDADPIATTTNVRVRIRATDETGLASFCIVRYRYDTPNRFWEPLDCTFEPLPAPESDGSFIVDTEISPIAGVAYAFAWVRDTSGNISPIPGFDVISFIPGAPLAINRNDIRIFRIPLAVGQEQVLSFTPITGDVDVAVFDDFTNPNAARIALSANNGTVCEEVTLTGVAGQSNRFQVELRAVVNSRVLIQLAACPAPIVAAASADANVPASLHAGPEQPLVAGPPARAAIEDEDVDISNSLYLPLVAK